jgi:uncharacterized protein (TIGR03083 family)
MAVRTARQDDTVTIDYLAELDRLTAAMADILADAVGDEPVPSCPDWTVTDLADHLGRVHRWAASIVLSGGPQDMPQPRGTMPMAEWYVCTARALAAALRAVDPDEPCWNHSGLEQTAGFWRRRMAHETQVHLVDAGLASGQAVPIDSDLAADGVDEVLTIYLHRLAVRGQAPVVDAAIVVRATDVDRQWMLHAAPEPGVGPSVTRPATADEATAEACVAGTAVDLYLGLWRRRGNSALDVRGEAADRFLDGPLTP